MELFGLQNAENGHFMFREPKVFVVQPTVHFPKMMN